MAALQLFTARESRSYDRALQLLEDVCARRARCHGEDAAAEEAPDVLSLTFAKVVSDCRAILLLARAGFYIQAGILSRSTMDACNLLVCAGFEGNDSPFIARWLQGRRVTHWAVVERLNEGLAVPEWSARPARGGVDGHDLMASL